MAFLDDLKNFGTRVKNFITGTPEENATDAAVSAATTVIANDPANYSQQGGVNTQLNIPTYTLPDIEPAQQPNVLAETFKQQAAPKTFNETIDSIGNAFATPVQDAVTIYKRAQAQEDAGQDISPDLKVGDRDYGQVIGLLTDPFEELNKRIQSFGDLLQSKPVDFKLPTPIPGVSVPADAVLGIAGGMIKGLSSQTLGSIAEEGDRLQADPALQVEANRLQIQYVRAREAGDTDLANSILIEGSKNPFFSSDRNDFGAIISTASLGSISTLSALLGIVPAISQGVDQIIVDPISAREYKGLPGLNEEQNATVHRLLNAYQANKNDENLLLLNEVTKQNLTKDTVDNFELEYYVPKVNLSDQLNYFQFKNENAQTASTKGERAIGEAELQIPSRLPETGNTAPYAGKSYSEIMVDISGKSTPELSTMRGTNWEKYSRDISIVSEVTERLEAKTNLEFGKQMNALSGQPESIKSKYMIERDEVISAIRETRARVTLDVMNGKSYDQALKDANQEVNGNSKFYINGERIFDYWNRQTNLVQSTNSLYQGGLNTVANWQLDAQKKVNRQIENAFGGQEFDVLGKQTGMEARFYSALRNNLFAAAETVAIEVVGEKLGGKVAGKILGKYVDTFAGKVIKEGLQEVTTTPAYEILDAASKARENTFANFLTNLGNDFVAGGLLGAVGAAGGKDNNIIVPNRTVEHLDKVHEFNMNTIKADYVLDLSNKLIKDINDFAAGGESIYLSEVGKNKLIDKGKDGADDFTQEDFNAEALEQLKISTQTDATNGTSIKDRAARAKATYDEVNSKFKDQSIDPDVARKMNLQYTEGNSDFLYMGQTQGGTKTYADQLNLAQNATHTQIVAAIDEVANPIVRKQLTAIYAATPEGSEVSFLNKMIPENRFQYAKDSVAIPLANFVQAFTTKIPTFRPSRKRINSTVGALNDLGKKSFDRISKVQSGSIAIKGERFDIKQVPLSAGTTTYVGSVGTADANFKFLVTKPGVEPTFDTNGEIVNNKDAFLANFSYKEGGVPYLASEYINVEEPLSLTDENGEVIFTKKSNYSLDSDGDVVFKIDSYPNAIAAMKDMLSDKFSETDMNRVIKITERVVGDLNNSLKIQAIAAVFSNLVGKQIPSDRSLAFFVNDLLLANPFFAKELARDTDTDPLLKTLLESKPKDLVDSVNSESFKNIIGGVVNRILKKEGQELKDYVDNMNKTALVQGLFNRNIKLLTEQRLNGVYFLEAEGNLVQEIDSIIPKESLDSLSPVKQAKLKNTLANLYVFAEVFNSNLSNSFAGFAGSNTDAVTLYANTYVDTMTGLGFTMNQAEFDVFKSEVSRIALVAGDWKKTFNILPAENFKEAFSESIRQDLRKVAKSFINNSSVDIEATIPNNNLYFNIALISKAMVSRLTRDAGTQISGDFLMELAHLVKKMDGRDIQGSVQIENFYTSEDYITQDIDDFKSDFRKAYEQTKTKGGSIVSLFSNWAEELTNAYFINFKYRNTAYTQGFLDKMRYLAFADYKLDIQNPVIRSIADRFTDLTFNGTITSVNEGLFLRRTARALKAAGFNFTELIDKTGLSVEDIRDYVIEAKSFSKTSSDSQNLNRRQLEDKLDPIRLKLWSAFGAKENAHQEYFNLISSLDLNVEGFQREQLISIFANTINPREAYDIALAKFPGLPVQIRTILDRIELHEAALLGDFSDFYSKDLDGFLQSLFKTEGSVGNLTFDSKLKGPSALPRSSKAQYSIRVPVRVMDINDIRDTRIENESSLIINGSQFVNRKINQLVPPLNIGFWIDSQGYLNIESDDGYYLHRALRAYPDQSILKDIPDNPNKETNKVIRQILGNSKLTPIQLEEFAQSPMPLLDKGFWDNYVVSMKEVGVNLSDTAATKLDAYFSEEFNGKKQELFSIFVAPNSRTLLGNINRTMDRIGEDRVIADAGYQFDLSRFLYEELGYDNANKSGRFINTLNLVKWNSQSIIRFLDGNIKKNEAEWLSNVGRQFLSLGAGKILKASGISNARVGKYDFLTAMGVAEDNLERIKQVGVRFQGAVDSAYARGIGTQEGVIEGIKQTYIKSLEELDVPTRIALDLIDDWDPDQSYNDYIKEKTNRLGLDFQEVTTIKGAGAALLGAVADGKGVQGIELNAGIEALQRIEQIVASRNDTIEGFGVKGVIEYINGIRSTTAAIDKVEVLESMQYDKDLKDLISKLDVLYEQGGQVRSPELLAVNNILGSFVPITAGSYKTALTDYFKEAKENNKFRDSHVRQYFSNEVAEYYRPFSFTISISKPILNDAASLVKGTLIDNSGTRYSQYEGIKIYNSKDLSRTNSGYRSTMLFTITDGKLLPLPRGAKGSAYIVSFDKGAFEKTKDGRNSLGSYLASGIPVTKKGIHYISVSELQTEIVNITDTYNLPVKQSVQKEEVYNRLAAAFKNVDAPQTLIDGIKKEGTLPRDLESEIPTLTLILNDYIPNADVLKPEFGEARNKIKSLLEVNPAATNGYLASKLLFARLGINDTTKFVEDYRKFASAKPYDLKILVNLYRSLTFNTSIDGLSNLKRSLDNLVKMEESSDILENRKEEISSLLKEVRALGRDIRTFRDSGNTDSKDYTDKIKQLEAVMAEVDQLNTYGESDFGVLTSELSRLVELANPDSPSLAPIELKKIIEQSYIDSMLDEEIGTYDGEIVAPAATAKNHIQLADVIDESVITPC